MIGYLIYKFPLPRGFLKQASSGAKMGPRRCPIQRGTYGHNPAEAVSRGTHGHKSVAYTGSSDAILCIDQSGTAVVDSFLRCLFFVFGFALVRKSLRCLLAVLAKTDL